MPLRQQSGTENSFITATSGCCWASNEWPVQAMETSWISPWSFAKNANLQDRPWYKTDAISNNLQLISGSFFDKAAIYA